MTQDYVSTDCRAGKHAECEERQLVVGCPCECHAVFQEIDHLRSALSSRETIGMAKGILMARETCDAETAFDMLSRASQRENRKLAELAKWIVDQAETKARRTRRPTD